MKITKYGHACLLIEEAGAKLLTDPGVFNKAPEVGGLDAILITHEHQDHCDTDQIQKILSENPDVTIYTHEGVGRVLIEAGIPFTIIGEGEEVQIKGVTVRSYGTEHAVIYKTMPCQNTGFMIANRFFYPGDSFVVPQEPIEILAVPTGGPWMKLAETIEYVKKVQPKVFIPVHDAMHIEVYRLGPIQRTLIAALPVGYRHMTEGSVEEF